ncbi:MAG TPA: glycosyl transferase family 2 [Cyanobacteria bacterium UBA9971]|nr:glycosyl transferase family 2 [Cyanobacteria bacterium UBA9971]
MLKGKKIIVVMPAYNAAKTLIKTYEEVMDQEIVDLVIIVDDASSDDTLNIANTLNNVKIHLHEKNKGYGGNQKSCYNLALQEGADIVIMVHPDYQYTPKLIPAMAGMIVNNLYHCVLGSRILGGETLKGGMPLWKYIINRILTESENFILGANLSEYHTGYRAFSRELLENLPLEKNSDGFIFDNEVLAQILWLGYPIGEVSCPTHYFPEASSISLWNSIKYGLGVFKVAFTYRFAKIGLVNSLLFSKKINKKENTKQIKGLQTLNESIIN